MSVRRAYCRGGFCLSARLGHGCHDRVHLRSERHAVEPLPHRHRDSVLCLLIPPFHVLIGIVLLLEEARVAVVA